MKTEETQKAISIVEDINDALGQFEYETTNKIEQFYLLLTSNGDGFEITFLGEQMFSSENDIIEDDGTPEHPALEQMLWDRMHRIIQRLENIAPFIYGNTTRGRGLS